MKIKAAEIKSKGFCLANLKVDEQKAKDGIWFDYIEGVKFLLARSGSAAYSKWLSNYMKEHETVIKSGTEEGDRVAELGIIEAVARFELRDWSGVVDENGEVLPYSVEKAMEYLDIEEVFEFVRSKTAKRELWRVQSTQELGKN